MLRNRLGDQMAYHRLCERTHGCQYNLLEWAGLALSQRPPDTKGALAAMKFEADIAGLRRADAHGGDAGPGTGKSSIIAWDIHQTATTRPRSCWVIVGSTYKQVLTRPLPSTVAGLERLGYRLGRDFYIAGASRRPR